MNHPARGEDPYILTIIKNMEYVLWILDLCDLHNQITSDKLQFLQQLINTGMLSVTEAKRML